MIETIKQRKFTIVYEVIIAILALLAVSITFMDMAIFHLLLD